MNQSQQQDIREYIFLELRKRGPLRPVRLSNMNQVVLKAFSLDQKELMSINGIYDQLANLELLEIRRKDSTGNSISPHIYLINEDQRITSVKDRIAQKENENKDAILIKEQEEKDKALDRRLKESQLWIADYWWIPSLFSLIMGLILQKFFKLI